jgi:hypothetical protein
MVAPVLVGFQDYFTDFMIYNSKVPSYCKLLQKNADIICCYMCLQR